MALAIVIATLGLNGRTSSAAPPQRSSGVHRDHGRLATDLRDDAGLDAGSAQFRPNSAAPRDTANRVHVLVEGHDASQVQQAVEANGGAVDGAVPGKVDAQVPADRLAALSDDPRVTFVQDGQQYHNTAGTITSEGVANTKANVFQSGGLTRQGAGVNVAVIDVAGFQGYDTELGDELPPVVTKKNFCGSNPDVFDSTFTADPHGTEVAAIIHDMAPSAGLVLICAKTDVQIVQAQDYILGLNSDGIPGNDVSIVNASWGDPVEGRGDGNGGQFTAEGVVRTLRQNNVLWVASSGNDGAAHDTFTPAGPDGPDFGLGDGPSIAWAPGKYSDTFTIQPNQTVDVLVKWDSWTGPPQDFDVGILNAQGVLVASSGQIQAPGVDPVEIVELTNRTGAPANLRIVILRFSATANPRFDTYIEFAPSELVNASGSVTMPATSPYAFSVGAACVSNNILEPFSGQGPTIDGRLKPEITGPDGTSGQVTNSISPYGAANSTCTSGFTGTSASAPHVAGAAAALLGALPGTSAGGLQQMLTCSAVDAGAGGPDNQFGFGRLDMSSLPPNPPANGMKPAIVRGTTVFERNDLCSGPADTSLNYGAPGDQVLLCDWDGNGTRTPGVFRNGFWLLRNADGNGPQTEPTFQLGDPGDIPVCGHWSTATPGKAETAGVFRKGVFYLKFQNTTGIADTSFAYGNVNDVPVTGDWNGDGITTVGVYRSGTWFLRDANGGGFSDLPPVGYGDASDVPVVGDWDGNGTTTMGVYRNGAWLLRNDNSGGFSTLPSFLFGSPGDRPQAWR